MELFQKRKTTLADRAAEARKRVEGGEHLSSALSKSNITIQQYLYIQNLAQRPAEAAVRPRSLSSRKP